MAGGRLTSGINVADFSAAFKLHYSLKLIIEVGLPRRCETPLHQGSSEDQIKQIRANPMDDKHLRSNREHNPVAELARLIAQADTHEESAPSDNRSREEAPSHGHDE